jgi:hypothetical protein
MYTNEHDIATDDPGGASILHLPDGVTLLLVDEAADLGDCCRRVAYLEIVWSGHRLRVGVWLEPLDRDRDGRVDAVEGRLQTLAALVAGPLLASLRLCDELEHAAEEAVLVNEIRPRLAVRRSALAAA